MVTHAKGLTISGVSDPLFAVKADNEIIWHEKIQNYLDDDAVWIGREALRFTVRLLYDREWVCDTPVKSTWTVLIQRC